MLWARIQLMVRRTRCNIISFSLSVTCGRGVVFSGYFCFLHQENWPPLYNWNIVDSGVKRHSPHPFINESRMSKWMKLAPWGLHVLTFIINHKTMWEKIYKLLFQIHYMCVDYKYHHPYPVCLIIQSAYKTDENYLIYYDIRVRIEGQEGRVLSCVAW